MRITKIYEPIQNHGPWIKHFHIMGSTPWQWETVKPNWHPPSCVFYESEVVVQLYVRSYHDMLPNEHQETRHRRLEDFWYVDQVLLWPTHWMSDKSFDQTWRKLNVTPSTKNPLNVTLKSKHTVYPVCSGRSFVVSGSHTSIVWMYTIE